MRQSVAWLIGFGLVVGCGGGGEEKDTGASQKDAFDVGSDAQDTSAPNDEGGQPKPDLSVPDKGGTLDSAVDQGGDKGSVDQAAQDTGPVGCPPVYTGESCHEMVACALQCDDETYRQQCAEQGDQAAVAKYQQVMDCLDSLTDCAPTEDGLFASCAAACKTEIGECFAGQGDCSDIRKCRVACDPEDIGCPVKCLGEGDADAQELWRKYVNCILAVDCAQTDTLPNGWPSGQCEKNAQMLYCPQQTQACLNPLG